jgi:hypothetical protein
MLEARAPDGRGAAQTAASRFALDCRFVPGTVLIASPEYLSILQARDEFREAMAFSDADALRALDAITRHRPGVVALERLFAATSRGAALINRIKADPALAGCEIRIVAHDSPYARTPVRHSTPPSGGAVPAAAADPVPAPAQPLDQRGTRRAPRFKMAKEVEVFVDGNPATLVDVSSVGAQVVSLTVLRPNQRVRLSLPDSGGLIRVSGTVVWAAFEMPKGGPRYRAGIALFDSDPSAIQRFIDANT